MRLTNARAVVGDLRSTSHFARVSREPLASGGSGCRNAGTPKVTSLPGLSQSPLFNTWVSRGDSSGEGPWRAISVKVGVPSGHWFHSAWILSLVWLNSGTVVRQ